MSLYLEDFAPGQRYSGTQRIRIEEDRIKSFAAEFDPQPFHQDAAAANASLFRGLALLLVSIRRRRCFEFSFQVADSQTTQRKIRIPIERCIADRHVAFIRSVDRIERRGAIFDAATDRSNLIHRPTQTHGSVATDTAIGRAQTGHAAR